MTAVLFLLCVLLPAFALSLKPSLSREVTCSSDYTATSYKSHSGEDVAHSHVPGCHPSKCGRYVYDDFASPAEVARLKEMCERAISAAKEGTVGRPGPTIVDINSGYLRDDEGLFNMYESNAGTLFSDDDYSFYRGVIERLRVSVSETFGLENAKYPYFTATTFITRLQHDDEWRPRGMHDVYWMDHVDKNNTGHYDYSGLLYLSTADDDFTGGMFEFVNESEELDEHGYPTFTLDEAVAPKAGRMITFTAGNENPHKVNIVRSGTRYVLSFWFTCDSVKEFGTFLDGSVHGAYGKRAEAMEKEREKEKEKEREKDKEKEL
jgi:hypothetical protein